MFKFSIIIPLYNKEKDIKKTISSFLEQTFNDFELIIVNDGSTDSSEEIVKAIQDKRITIFSKKNEGVSIARNFGVEKSNTNYIAFLDGDDYWYPNHLENLFSLINNHPDHSWYATAYEKKRTSKLTTPMVSPIRNRGDNWMGEVDTFFENSYIDCLAWTSAVCMKKDFYNSLNGFNTTITHGEDTDLWIRAALKSSIIFSNTITARHQLDGENRSSKILSHNRKRIQLNNFEEAEKSNPSLKKYLDLNRYSLALQHKVSGDLSSFKKYREGVNIENLNNKQRFLLRQNRTVLQVLIRLQKIAEWLGLRLSSF